MQFGRQNKASRQSAGPDCSLSNNGSTAVSPHLFSGRLIDGREAADWLTSAIAASPCYISLCTAYLRSDALSSLLAGRTNELSGRILVRWQLADLMSGASDLRAYHVAKASGLQLLIRLDFHGKVFAIPDRGIVVGSANATLSGFGLRAESNEEVCTTLPALPENLAHIERLFVGAVLVDDELFAEISAAVQNLPLESRVDDAIEWPEGLLSKLRATPLVDRLLLSEFFCSGPQLSPSGYFSVLDGSDRKLLSLVLPQMSAAVAVGRLRKTKAFRWLCQCLERAGGQLFFGALTVALHDSLLDDPATYRRDVKVLLQHLLAWCEAIPEAGVLVDRPKHSQRVRLYDIRGLASEATKDYSVQGRDTSIKSL
jgi:hypothetical protein